MGTTRSDRVHDRWAELKFSIVGRLMSAPPAKGQLASELHRLSETWWTHPVTGDPVQFAFSTLERWYYQARRAQSDRFGALRRKPRSDGGTRRAVGDAAAARLRDQYREHPSWSYQLHTDNLAARVTADPELGPMPSYASVRRYLQSQGLFKRKRPRRNTAGARRAEARFESREVRSFEVAEVNALWHLDYHHASRSILTPAGGWQKPVVLGVLDDRSRLICHLQWYVEETAENLIHALSQAFHKRGLPAGLLTDNGGPMVAEETTSGLQRLGITHETTLPYSPYQNGKQEAFWGQLEGRLMAMLESCHDLTLSTLNTATVAWAEIEYNHRCHGEIGEAPYARFLRDPNLGREAPSAHDLRIAFTMREARTQRRSDGTVSIQGCRFEVPSRFRHLARLCVSYARWDLSFVHLIDPRAGTVMARLYPQDKLANADRHRRTRGPAAGVDRPTESTEEPGIAPLLQALMTQYAATGLPPAFLPKADRDPEPASQETPS